MKYKVKVNGKEYVVEVESLDSNEVISNNDPFANVAKIESKPVEQVEVAKPVQQAGPGAITSPLSGEITKINVKVGDSVEYGDVVCNLEAMKMDNDVVSEVAGIIKNISVNIGDVIKQGHVIMSVE